jgi:hypothetical protein
MTVGRIPSVEGGIQPTIVDAKGDLIAAVAADSLNRLAVGSNDQVLVADSAASTGLAWKSYGAQVVAGKNAIINGGMDVWQRGTTNSMPASTTRSAGFGADRFQMETGANQATTISRQSVSDTTNLPSIQYCTRIQRNSGQTGTGTQYFTQSLETANSIPLVGKTVTLSFYARAGANYSPTSSILKPTIWSNTTTDSSVWAGGWNTVASPSVTLTTTWQRFSVTGTITATQTQIAIGFEWSPTGTAGANDYYEVTGVQLELGSTATPFSRAGGTSYGEQALCMRYFYRQQGQTTACQLAMAMSRAAGTAYALWNFPVPLRTTTPTLTATNIAASAAFQASLAGNDYTADTLGAFAAGSETKWMITIPTSGATVGWAGWFQINANKTTSYIEVSAEL